MSKKPSVPRRLSAESRRIWREIEGEWELDTHSRTILEVSLEAFDEMRKAQDLVNKHGQVVKSESGFARLNPAVNALKIARSQFLHAWKMLNLGIEPPEGR